MYDKSVTFAGYSPEKLFPTRLDEMKEDKIRMSLFQSIAELYGQGYRTFVSDLSAGFCLMAADTVIMLRDSKRCPDIRLVAMITGKRQPEKYDKLSGALFKDLLEQANEVKTLSGKEYEDRTQESSHVVCYFNAMEAGELKKIGIPFTNIREKI